MCAAEMNRLPGAVTSVANVTAVIEEVRDNFVMGQDIVLPLVGLFG